MSNYKKTENESLSSNLPPFIISEILSQLYYSNLNKERSLDIKSTSIHLLQTDVINEIEFIPMLFVTEDKRENILINAVTDIAYQLRFNLITNLDYKNSNGYTDMFCSNIYCDQPNTLEQLKKIQDLSLDKNVFIEFKNVEKASKEVQNKILEINKNKSENLFFCFQNTVKDCDFYHKLSLNKTFIHSKTIESKKIKP